MKRITSTLLLTLCSAMLLGSCSFGINTGGVTLNNVTRDVFSVEKFRHNEGNRSASKIKTITFKVNPIREHVLYCDLPTYADMVCATMGAGYTYTVNGTEWVVKRGDTPVFVAGISLSERRFTFAGSISGAFPSDPISYGTLVEGLKVDNTIIKEGTSVASASFADFDAQLPLYYGKDVLYAPVALYDAVFAESTGFYHFDNFEDIFQYGSAEDLTVKLGKGDKAITDNLAAFHKASATPADVRLLERATFYFTMDNFYGLRFHKGIEKMSDFYRGAGLDKLLVDEDDGKRCAAYYDAVGTLLNDDHTGLTEIATHWGDDAKYSVRGQVSNDRKALGAGLAASRKQAYEKESFTPLESVRYSSSGETAFFSFDSFRFERQPYEEDGKTKKPDLWKTDTAAYFAKAFEEIKAKGGVKRVIIDDSCNGGGTLGVAYKTLCLVSKDNQAYLDTERLEYGMVTRANIGYDRNLDGKYDAEDVYGDDFEISILTSPRSFSCGNLFPIQAKTLGVKTIGVKSGGGECVVGSHMLPSGRSLTHSSMTRLVTYDATSKTITGFERGASPDIEVDYSHFYDVDYLEGVLVKE